MKYLVLTFVFAAGFAAAHLIGIVDAQPQTQQRQVPPKNPNIDFAGHMKVAIEAEQHRENRRVTEEDFIKMSKEEGVIILDARSKEMYDLLHIEGAINLSFPDIDIESLKKTLPDKNARILIYCNNNFTDAKNPPNPNDPGMQGKAAAAFRGKAPPMSLNISTYTTLYGYGYKNVYELGPLVDPAKTKIKLVSSEK